MNKISVFIILLIFLTALTGFSLEPLANEDNSGLYARSIEQMLRLEAHEIDLATAALIISEEWSDLVQGRRYQADLEDMAREIQERIEKQNLNRNPRAIKVINNYLFNELGFISVDKAHTTEDLFLHTVMDKKQGYCLSLSILYLSIGERLGLPLYGVVVPSHFFIRYDDGNIQFNIETTAKGGSASDEDYIKKFKVEHVSQDSLYMKNLDKKQVLGCLFNNLGNVYSEIGDLEYALLALERAVQINPSLAESRTNLGNIYLKKGRIRDAIYEYEAALDINPNEALIHSNLGNAYLEDNWLSYAISEYQQAIRLDPNFVDGYKNLAIAYARDKQLENAAAILNQAIALEPDNIALYIHLGNFYQQSGRYHTAIAEYHKALFIKPDIPEAYFGIGNCYNKLDDVDKGIDALKKAIQIKPTMVEALTNLGNTYFSQGNYEPAIILYQKALRIKPNDKNLHFNLGSAYYNISDYDNSVLEYTKAVEIDPKMSEAQKGLAMSYVMLKNYDSALYHVKIAQELGADIPDELLMIIKENTP
ncbi:MAG: tetratricopeptide repeat protein [Planctomycetota bacterium]|jgi:tetratricopeptide (TPR) repeat protein